MYKYCKKSKFSLIIISILSGFVFTYFYYNFNDNSSAIQKNIATKIIRFHVLANSDSEEDQELKLKVKDAVVNYISPKLSKSESLQMSRQIIDNNTQQILYIAKNVITANGYNYDVSASFSNTYFPTKTYGNYTFPPGYYEAYQIKIGKSEGKNWWCVLYPPLCFIDVSHGYVNESSENMLHQTLTTEEYETISSKAKVKYRFKYLRFLNKFID